MRLLKHWQASLVALVLVMATLILPFAGKADVTFDKLSTASLPFSGTFFNSVTQENVNASGAIVVVTHVPVSKTGVPTSPFVQVLATLPLNVIATGQSTGRQYLLNGSLLQTVRFTPKAACIPSDPCTPPNPIRVQFALVPAVQVPGDPIRPNYLFFNLNLNFATTGALVTTGTNPSTTSVAGDSFNCLPIDGTVARLNTPSLPVK